MDWQSKIKLVQLGNQTVDFRSREKFREFILKNIDDFDYQSFGMMITSLDLRQEYLIENKKFASEINTKISDLDLNKFSTREGMRLSIFQITYNKIFSSN